MNVRVGRIRVSTPDDRHFIGGSLDPEPGGDGTRHAGDIMAVHHLARIDIAGRVELVGRLIRHRPEIERHHGVLERLLLRRDDVFVGDVADHQRHLGLAQCLGQHQILVRLGGLVEQKVRFNGGRMVGCDRLDQVGQKRAVHRRAVVKLGRSQRRFIHRDNDDIGILCFGSRKHAGDLPVLHELVDPAQDRKIVHQEQRTNSTG